MTNKYAGKCGYCGMTVPAGAGTLKNEHGQWMVYHSEPCLDIESGLGIGRINDDQSMPIIPSERAIERMQRAYESAEVCRRCGASSLNGAMFTTLGGSGICDDCA